MTDLSELDLQCMSREEYDKLPGERYSFLKYILQSPKHYAHVIKNGTERKACFDFGHAFHVATLQPSMFSAAFAAYPGKQRRGNEYELWKRCNPGASDLLASDYETVTAMALSVRSDPAAAKYLVEGMPESVVRWLDDQSQIMCKTQMDWVTSVTPTGLCVVELKSTKDAGSYSYMLPDADVLYDDELEHPPRGFAKQTSELLYHMQFAMHVEGVEAVTGIRPDHVVIAVEKVPPYDVVVYPVPEETIEAGSVVLHRALGVLALCRKTGTWPGKGRGQNIPLRLPMYAPGRPDDEFKVMHFPGVGEEK